MTQSLEANHSGRLSQELLAMLPSPEVKAVCVGDLLLQASDRGVLLLVLILATPFCLPIPVPGLSTPFGFVLISCGLKWIRGGSLWLPERVRIVEIPSPVLRSILDRILVVVKFLERSIYPRGGDWVGGVACFRFYGFWLVLHSVFLALPLPIPATNFIPAFPIVVMTIGMLERDGLCLIAGFMFALASAIIFCGLIVLIANVGAEGAARLFGG